MGQYPMLRLRQKAASASQRATTHFEDLNRRIRLENEILVRSNEHKDEHEGTGHDHAVGNYGHSIRGKNCGQIYPASDIGR